MTKKAIDFYHKKEHYNCAQSVIVAYGNEDNLDEYKAYGGGRAPGNLCGALFAGVNILGEADQSAIMDYFIYKAGTAKCRELKANKFPCTACVEIIDDWFAENKDK